MKEIKNLGTNEETFFFDTYAIIEVVRGNPKYQKYINCSIITTVFNLAELNYNLKKEKDKVTADNITDKYKDEVVEVTIEDVKNAMDLKIKNKNMSIPDVIGYVVAERQEVKFLTGDEDFKHFDNVEFVKK